MISIAQVPGYLEEGKDSLEESFTDAKEDLASVILTVPMHREVSHGNIFAGITQSMKTEGSPSSRKREKTEQEVKEMVPKIAR